MRHEILKKCTNVCLDDFFGNMGKWLTMQRMIWKNENNHDSINYFLYQIHHNVHFEWHNAADILSFPLYNNLKFPRRQIIVN
jgi:hypothetical protein